MDEGLAMLFGKGAAGTGDIALYLKRMFNEDTEPDDDDIAVLAGLISAQQDESDEEEDADAGVEAAAVEAKEAAVARAQEMTGISEYDEAGDLDAWSERLEAAAAELRADTAEAMVQVEAAVDAQEMTEIPVYGELPAGVGISDLFMDDRVQAVLRELVAAGGGGESESTFQPPPELEPQSMTGGV